ncbi:MAG: hypothetical protein JWP13_393 [Candidatus Saccharibacteria bacterium]|nr:hypothetical protein [Candidatus Saccharibacteria bacterium]
MMHPRAIQKESGFILPTVLSFMIAGIIIAGVVLQVILNNFFIVGNNVQRQQAFNIAEAGVNYYLWHLSHNPNDFRDGKTTPATPDPALGYGPYEHTYIDDNAVNRGTFTLWIKPHGNGSTLVDVRAIGKVKDTKITRTVEARIGATSFGNYALVSDSALWFGANESADGPVHSNIGVRMDGPSNDTVSSSNSTYTPSSAIGGDGTAKNGVWCNTSVTAPVDCTTRNKSEWTYPTTSVDFNQVSSSLCTIKKVAFASDSTTASLATQTNACSQTPTGRTPGYLPQRSSSANTSRGYLIQLNPNGTYDLFTVNNENDTLANYSAALSPTSVATGIAIPSSGVIFAEDNVWVRSNPTYHGRVTIGAGRLATTNGANIKVADDLVYSTKNGEDAIGLVAEDSVLIAPYAAPATGAFTLEVNAAMLAQSGNVIYPSNYNFSNTTCTRGWIGSDQKLKFYGSVATRQTWTWSWQRSGACGDSVYDSSSGYYISGFKYNTTEYDRNLLFAPPPNYPITGGYNILVWREVLTKP